LIQSISLIMREFIILELYLLEYKSMHKLLFEHINKVFEEVSISFFDTFVDH